MSFKTISLHNQQNWINQTVENSVFNNVSVVCKENTLF